MKKCSKKRKKAKKRVFHENGVFRDFVQKFPELLHLCGLKGRVVFFFSRQFIQYLRCPRDPYRCGSPAGSRLPDPENAHRPAHFPLSRRDVPLSSRNQLISKTFPKNYFFRKFFSKKFFFQSYHLDFYPKQSRAVAKCSPDRLPYVQNFFSKTKIFFFLKIFFQKIKFFFKKYFFSIKFAAKSVGKFIFYKNFFFLKNFFFQNFFL